MPAPTINVLYADYLGTGSGLMQLCIVFDGEYQPEDYDLLNVPSGDVNALLVCAHPDADGTFSRRSMLLSAAQLTKLEQERQIGSLIFENGDALATLDMKDLLQGDLCKLMALLLRQEENVSPDVLNRDWSQMPEVELSAEELEEMQLEIRIVPMELEDGAPAYAISVWLRWNEQELEVSAMLPSLRVCMNVDALAEAESAHCAVGYRAENVQNFRALESIRIRIPEELPETQLDEAEKFSVTIPEDGSAPDSIQNTIPLPPDRHTALAANYAGAGIYRAMQVE